MTDPTASAQPAPTLNQFEVDPTVVDPELKRAAVAAGINPYGLRRPLPDMSEHRLVVEAGIIAITRRAIGDGPHEQPWWTARLLVDNEADEEASWRLTSTIVYAGPSITDLAHALAMNGGAAVGNTYTCQVQICDSDGIRWYPAAAPAAVSGWTGGPAALTHQVLHLVADGADYRVVTWLGGAQLSFDRAAYVAYSSPTRPVERPRRRVNFDGDRP